MPEPTPLFTPEDAWLADVIRGGRPAPPSSDTLDTATLTQLRAEVNELRGVLGEAVASPDNPWLWRYFAEQAHVKPLPGAPLSDAERRWVRLLLTHSTTWQTRWQDLEADLGEAVPTGVGSSKTAPDRPAVQQPPARIYTLRRFLVAATVVVALYGVLWGVSRGITPETYALATLDPHASDLAVLTAPMRDATTSPDADPTVALSEGLQALEAAPTSTLGLFPSYDAQRVAEALEHLTRAYEASTDPVLQATAAFFIAKAHLMQGDASQAQTHLQDVAQRNTVYTDEAQALLAQLAH